MTGNTLVLDASAAGKLLRKEQESAALRAWMAAEIERGSRIVVPPIFPFELRNIAAKSVAEGSFLDEKEAFAAYSLVMDLVEIDADGLSPGEEIAIAVRIKLSIYDASYLILARAGQLVTYDAKLAKAAHGELGAPTIGPR